MKRRRLSDGQSLRWWSATNTKLMTIDEMPPYCYSNYKHNRGSVGSTNQGWFRILCLQAKFPFVNLSKILTLFLTASVEKEQELSDLSDLHTSQIIKTFGHTMDLPYSPKNCWKLWQKWDSKSEKAKIKLNLLTPQDLWYIRTCPYCWHYVHRSQYCKITKVDAR